LQFLVGASLAIAAEPSPDELFSAAMGMILQANGPKAVELLGQMRATRLEDKTERVRSCVLARLSDGAQADRPDDGMDAFARSVLTAYQTYWRNAVRRPDTRLAAEGQLLADLRRLLGRPDLADFTAAEPILSERLRQAGFNTIQGRVLPLRELMMWSHKEERTYKVALPGGTQTVRVFLLDGFVSRGWSNYMTCGRASTGGWAKPEGLFAVVPGYSSLASEDFRVSFLAHEAQHYADYRRFPSLVSWELEYRAKLTELALADESQDRILQKFAANQGDSIDAPHSYANKRVLLALRARLAVDTDAAISAVPAARVRQAAEALLRVDSRQRMQ
jgi:hypothetical protein